jgi:hypothetical protein
VQQQIALTAKKAGFDPETVAPSPPSLDAPADAASAILAMNPAEQKAAIHTMVDRLAAKMQENPNDLDGWLRLAKAYRVLGETDKAKEAESKAEALQPNPPQDEMNKSEAPLAASVPAPAPVAADKPAEAGIKIELPAANSPPLEADKTETPKAGPLPAATGKHKLAQKQAKKHRAKPQPDETNKNEVNKNREMENNPEAFEADFIPDEPAAQEAESRGEPVNPSLAETNGIGEMGGNPLAPKSQLLESPGAP